MRCKIYKMWSRLSFVGLSNIKDVISSNVPRNLFNNVGYHTRFHKCPCSYRIPLMDSIWYCRSIHCFLIRNVKTRDLLSSCHIWDSMTNPRCLSWDIVSYSPYTESLSTLCHIQRCRQSNITVNIYFILDNLRCFLALHKRCPVAAPTVPSANVGHETLVTERCSPVSTHPNYLPSI